jgi:hypothetical protein
MAKVKTKIADEMNGVPELREVDQIDLLLRRIDALAKDATALASDIDCQVRNNDRERHLLQSAHRALHDFVSTFQQARLRRDMRI